MEEELGEEENLNTHNLDYEVGMQELNMMFDKKLEITDEKDDIDNISELSFTDLPIESKIL